MSVSQTLQVFVAKNTVAISHISAVEPSFLDNEDVALKPLAVFKFN